MLEVQCVYYTVYCIFLNNEVGLLHSDKPGEGLRCTAGSRKYV